MNNILISNLLSQIKKNFNLKNKIGLHEPSFNKDDLQSVTNSIKTTHVSTYAKFTSLFEEKLKIYTKSNFAIATINGTSALHAILNIIGTKAKDEILLPALTFVGTANPILYCNAIPNFVDVEPNSFGIDPIKLELYLKKNCIIKNNKCLNTKTKRYIKALICVHIFGHSCQVDKIKKITDKYKLVLIEDAAEGIGSFYKKKHLGTFGEFGILSFNGNKTITTGGGGAILFQKKKYFNNLFKSVTVAKEKHQYEFCYKNIGYNYRMPSLNASLGISQLKNIKKILKKKKNIFKLYLKIFKKIDGIKLLKEPIFSRSNYWLNAIVLEEEQKKIKNKLIKILISNNFICRPLWIPLHKLVHFKNFPRDNLTCSENLYSRCISIPSSPDLFKFKK